jgi:hypothetical protein
MKIQRIITRSIEIDKFELYDAIAAKFDLPSGPTSVELHEIDDRTLTLTVTETVEQELS